MSQHELIPLIAMLERRVIEAETKANELLGALNILRAEAELPPRPSGIGGPDKGAETSSEIKPDTFFGKRQQTAVREFLQMRRGQGQGPAKPREIYDALTTGGFTYDAKDAETALVGLRALLRKRTNIFIKVGPGRYGLVDWYPDAKRTRSSTSQKPGQDDSNQTDDNDEDLDENAHENGTADGDDAPPAAVY